jgi:hypothetical protein
MTRKGTNGSELRKKPVKTVPQDETTDMLKGVYGDAPGVQLLGETIKIHEYINKKQAHATTPMEDNAFITGLAVWANDVEKNIGGKGIMPREELEKELYPLKNAELIGPDGAMQAYDQARHRIHNHLRQHPQKQEEIFGLDMIPAWEDIDILVDKDCTLKDPRTIPTTEKERNPRKDTIISSTERLACRMPMITVTR